MSSILIFGKMIDRLGMRFMCLFNTAIVVATFAVIITYNELQTYKLWASSGVCFLLGLNEAAVLLCISTMCGF